MIEDMPSLISTLGFPIAVCMFLFAERHYNNKANREERKENQEKLADAIKDFTSAITDLKVQIVKLNERCTKGV